jgi:predicted dehydrogenase
MNSLKIGLIGCGRAAERLYLPALTQLPQGYLVAVADPSPARRELIAAGQPGCRTFSSAEAMLQETELQAVIVTTPPETHLEIAGLALKKGMPVLVEKPLAPSLAGVEALAALERASRAKVMVGFNRRYWAPIGRLRQAMKHRSLTGQGVAARLVLTSNIQEWSPISRASDPLDDLGSHQLDLLRYIFDGEISAISAHWIDSRTVQMRVKIGEGIVAECLAGYSDGSQETIQVNCAGQQYRAQLGSERIWPAGGLLRTGFDLGAAVNRRLLGRRSTLRSSYQQQLSGFFYYVRTGTAPQPDLAAGIAVVQAVEAARQSATHNGQEVTITHE